MAEQTTSRGLLDAFKTSINADNFSWTSGGRTEKLLTIEIAPRPPLDVLLNHGQWPRAFIHADRGRILQDSAVWSDRHFDLTVFAGHGTDNVGANLTTILLDLHDALMDTFFNTADTAVWLSLDADVIPVYEEDELIVASKTWTFLYRLRRS